MQMAALLIPIMTVCRIISINTVLILRLEMQVNEAGCPDSDGDGIYDDKDNCPKYLDLHQIKDAQTAQTSILPHLKK